MFVEWRWEWWMFVMGGGGPGAGGVLIGKGTVGFWWWKHECGYEHAWF